MRNEISQCRRRCETGRCSCWEFTLTHPWHVWASRDIHAPRSNFPMRKIACCVMKLCDYYANYYRRYSCNAAITNFEKEKCIGTGWEWERCEFIGASRETQLCRAINDLDTRNFPLQPPCSFPADRADTEMLIFPKFRICKEANKQACRGYSR